MLFTNGNNGKKHELIVKKMILSIEGKKWSPSIEVMTKWEVSTDWKKYHKNTFSVIYKKTFSKISQKLHKKCSIGAEMWENTQRHRDRLMSGPEMEEVLWIPWKVQIQREKDSEWRGETHQYSNFFSPLCDRYDSCRGPIPPNRNISVRLSSDLFRQSWWLVPKSCNYIQKFDVLF